MKQHHLKCWPEPFREVKAGRKPFEIRRDDRGFQVGDAIYLHEWNPKTEKYTKAEVLTRKVLFILRGGFGLRKGYVILGIGIQDGEVVALNRLEEAQAARDFYREEWQIDEAGHRELREAVRKAGLLTNYFGKQGLVCFGKTKKKAVLRDALRELVYRMARHIRTEGQHGLTESNQRRSNSNSMLRALRALDSQAYREKVEF